MSRLFGFGWRFSLRFLAGLPYAPSIVALYWASTYCFTPLWASTGISPARCLLKSAYLAPATLLIGPLATFGEDAASMWLAVLSTALLMALLMTTVSLIVRRH